MADRAKHIFAPKKFLRLVGKPLYLLLLSFLAAFAFLSSRLARSIVQLIKLPRAHGKSSPKKAKHVTKKASTQLIKPLLKFIYYQRLVHLPAFSFKKPTLRLHLPNLTFPSFTQMKSDNRLKLPQFRWLRPRFTFKPYLKKLSLFKVKLHLPSISRPKPRFSLTHLFLLLLLSTASLVSFGFYQIILKDLPSPKDLLHRQQSVSTKIYDRNKILLYKFYENENRSITNLSSIPPYVIQATLAIEDSNFYDHAGFSFKGIARAFSKNLTEGKLQGGSTITQQLVKNTLLTPEKTIIRKAKELILALAVENYFTKDEILTMYFNEVPYGGTAYGIEEAAQTFFNKSVEDVTVAEAALLAALPAAPTVYSPFGANPELAVARQHEVLRRMVEEGYLSSADAQAAMEAPLNFASPAIDIKAPHFVMYVKDILARQYGDRLVNHGGLEVITSLDYDIQELAEAAVKKELERLKKLNVSNAAALVTDPQTGEVLAMVGSADYFDTKHDGQVNVTLRPRQPGSSIKPVTYALALTQGLTPATLINDSPVTYRTIGSPPYSPQNYDGRYHGMVTLRQALASSYNIPAVKVLNQVGLKPMIKLGQDMGITTWDDPRRFGLSLTLGGGEVRMIDMAVVYGTFANNGFRVDLQPLLEVNDYTNTHHDVYACKNLHRQAALTAQAHASSTARSCQGEPVLKPEVAYLISDILSDNNARAPAFGTHSVLNIPNHKVSVKTGTTNSLRDNWTIGYTKDYVVATWVGNNDNTPMSYVASGITGASPIWNQIITALLTHDSKPSSPDSNQSGNVVEVSICPLTGTLTCAECPSPKTEVFIKGTEPTTACNRELIDQALHPSPSETGNRDRINTGITTTR